MAARRCALPDGVSNHFGDWVPRSLIFLVKRFK
jgi:hypothetical protein